MYAHIIYDDIESDEDEEKGRGKRKRRTIQEAAERRALKEGRGLRNSILVDVLSILSDVVINTTIDLGDEEETQAAKNWSKVAGALKLEWRAGNLLHAKAGEQLMELDHLAQCRLRLRSNKDTTLSADRLANSMYGIVIEGTEELRLQEEMMRLPVLVSDMNEDIRQLSYLLGVQKRQEGIASETKKKQDLEDGMCPICRDVHEVMYVYPCAHMTCSVCTKKLSQNRTIVTCCVCRQRFRKKDLIRARRKTTTNVTTSTTNKKKKNKKVEEEDLPPVVPDFKALASNVIQYGTKIAALVREISLLCWREPDVKILIFSTWDDVLRLIANALQDQGLSFLCLQDGFTGRNNRRVSGGKGSVLEQFRTDNSIRSLLLPVRAGANGINLTEATHVFFANPLLSAEEEAQAIGRVHRIGQTKTTTVHHFYIKDTIEARIIERGNGNGDSSMEGKARASALLVNDMLKSSTKSRGPRKSRGGRRRRGRGRGRSK